MTAIKIYTATPADLSPPVQSESFCVDLVLASDYQALEARCAALTAECQSKKSALEAILEHCPVNDPDIDKAVAAMIAYDNLYCEKTPATDDFLAEVRAQSADELAELYFTLAAHEANRYIADSWRESARFAKDHAAQLRKGVAQ